MLHNSGDCFGKRSDQKSIKYGLGGPMGSRAEAVKQYKRSENKWKKEFIISRILRMKLPGSTMILATTLLENIQTPPYPVIATAMNIDILMKVGR